MARLNLAAAVQNRGDRDRALAELALAREAAERSGDPLSVARVDITWARLAWHRAEQLGEAYRLLRTMEREQLELLDYHLQVSLYHVLARLCDLTDRDQEAMAWQQKVTELARAEGDVFVEISGRVTLARWAHDHGSQRIPGGDLAAYVAETAKMAEKMGNTYAAADSDCLLAELERSDAAFAQCVEAFRALGSPYDLAEALARWATLLPPDQVEVALSRLDEARALLDDPELHAHLDWHRAGVLLRAGRGGDALVAAQQAVDDVETLFTGGDAADGHAGMLSQWAGLYLDLAALQAATSDESASWWTVEQLRARSLRRALHSDRDVALLGLDEVQARLAADEVLLSFQLPPASSVVSGGSVWVITSQEVRLLPLPSAEELGPRLEVYEGLLLDGAPDEPRAGAVLYDLVLREALDGLPPEARHLLLVLDGALHGLPVGALRSAEDVPRLHEQYTISLVPSASVWAALRAERDRDFDGPVLVLADPAFAVGEGWADEALPRLPGAREEARAVARRVASAVRLDAAATEDALASVDAPVLHFAAHAVHDHSFPEQSAILLAPGPESDGRLEVAEIRGLDLHDRLVVLSACRSAGGRVLGGEGPMGFAHGFFGAGAAVVVGTRWPLPDHEAAPFFEAFYDVLADGETVAEAVAHARRERADAGAPPQAWAGVVVLGDGSRRVALEASGRPGLSWFVGVVGGLALLLGSWRLRWRGSGRRGPGSDQAS